MLYIIPLLLQGRFGIKAKTGSEKIIQIPMKNKRFMYNCHPQPSHQLPFDQGVQISIYPKFSGLCTRTNRSHLAVFYIDKNSIVVMASSIALPLDSLLLRGVSAGPCFCLWSRCCKHARRRACTRDGLKQGPTLTPRNNRL